MTDLPRLSHAALEDPGKSHPGAQLDCVACFNELSTAPSTVQDPYDPARPHLMLPPGRTVPINPAPPSSVDPRTCAYCGTQDRNCTFCKHRPPVAPTHPDVPSEHVTWSRATPAGPASFGGQWMAGCSCGWRKGGTYYGSGGEAESEAGQLARRRADEHLEQEGER